MAVVEEEIAQEPEEERAVRAELRQWLDDHLPSGWMQAVDQGDRKTLQRLRDQIDYAQWCKTLADAGWATPTYPPEHNGRGYTNRVARVVSNELNRAGVPRSYNVIGIGMAAPTILQWGTEEQKKLIPKIASHEEIWCQLFSEPGAGSDVAGLSTRAVRDGDEWVVNGQKVWTTLAHLSKWGMLVARTDPEQPKHRGLTYFILDMKAPGVEVRPLRQMTGDAEFNEVYLTDVRVPDAMRLGDVGRGWDVAITTLMNERVALGGGGGAGLETNLVSPVDALVVLARKMGKAGDRVLRQRIAQHFIEYKAIRYTNQRSQASLRAGKMPGPEGSIGKLFQAEWNQRLQATVIDTLGAYGLARFGVTARDGMLGIPMRGGGSTGVGHDSESAEHPTVDLIYTFLRSRANTIEGGTSEIMRNILGERVLGLPKEPQVDRDIPWSQVRRSG
jgi:alkylation response protein AidB-like acyl-CoA dehydrogenase